ncbi:MAG: sulfotransferase family protein [Thermoanaerobaculia bacterium]
MTLTAQPVIILGAARSGTNALRDALTRFEGVGTWPCDEINYIWRHGNARYPTDEFSRSMATPKVIRYIRRAFEIEARRQHLTHIVEKTCANTLRVQFVDEVLPEAKFIYILRDGRDVVASARERWTADLDLRYTLKKVRYVPPFDVPLYAWLQLRNRAQRLFSSEKQLGYWGPRFVGLTESAGERSLEEICALQWVRSVERAEADLRTFDPKRVITVRYEDFATSPIEQMRHISAFLEVPMTAAMESHVRGMISARSVGRWRATLADDVSDRILPIMAASLRARGYAS